MMQSLAFGETDMPAGRGNGTPVLHNWRAQQATGSSAGAAGTPFWQIASIFCERSVYNLGEIPVSWLYWKRKPRPFGRGFLVLCAVYFTNTPVKRRMAVSCMADSLVILTTSPVFGEWMNCPLPT